MRACFFDYDVTIGSYRYLTIPEGETVTAHESHQHEEGWDATWIEWSFDGEVVTCRTVTDGRDCDGRMITDDAVTCPVADLASVTPYAPEGEAAPPFLLPAWQAGRRSQRDYTAEAAGY
jgi:hypothetical protein